MATSTTGLVAIVDHGMGNLFSVRQACESAGLRSIVANSARILDEADAVILPGVGAFADAMATLNKLGLIEALMRVANSSRPLVGICLGMQLLMTESEEFGNHRGLDIVKGQVLRLPLDPDVWVNLKVPQVGWNQIFQSGKDSSLCGDELVGHLCENPLMTGLRNGEYMYFVHSFYAVPSDTKLMSSTTKYGALEFCSSFRQDNVFGFQFHPERSGPAGEVIYRNLANFISAHPGDQNNLKNIGS